MSVVERERLVGLHQHDTALEGLQDHQRKKYLGNAHCAYFQRALYTGLSGYFRIAPVRYEVPTHQATASLATESSAEIIALYHKLAGHQGPTKTLNLAG